MCQCDDVGVRTTIDLPDDLHAQAVAIARDTHRSLSQTVVGVTKSRSFSQAARALGISGSLVSRHVAELERELGVHLVTAPPGRSV
jgi:hypothetical protein